MDTNYAKQLLQRYREGSCNIQEKELVEQQWYPQLIETGEWQWNDEEKQVLQQTIEANLMRSINSNKITTRLGRIHFIKPANWRAAAAIIILLGAGIYFMFFNKMLKNNEVVKLNVPENNIIAPTASKATITLANGDKVYLDNASNGQLALQGNIKLVKLDNGQLAYQPVSAEALTEMKYNTVTNPRGSAPYKIILIDGSRVWLNAGSAITFPVAFVSNERKVSISGEAYFEIAHDIKKPFFVTKADVSVQVIGTHFNVNAFDDEADTKVTLLEGSVKVSSSSGASILKPGQQAQVSNSIKLLDGVDMKAVMAWKNGFFNFNNADIKQVMQEIARWYDVDVVYEAAIPKLRFGGELSRATNLSQVLEILKTSGVKFSMEGRRLTIKP